MTRGAGILPATINTSFFHLVMTTGRSLCFASPISRPRSMRTIFTRYSTPSLTLCHGLTYQYCNGPPSFSRSPSETSSAAVWPVIALIRGASATAFAAVRGTSAAVRREASFLHSLATGFFPARRWRHSGKPLLPRSSAALLQRHVVAALFAILALRPDRH